MKICNSSSVNGSHISFSVQFSTSLEQVEHKGAINSPDIPETRRTCALHPRDGYTHHTPLGVSFPCRTYACSATILAISPTPIPSPLWATQRMVRHGGISSTIRQTRGILERSHRPKVLRKPPRPRHDSVFTHGVKAHVCGI